MAKEVSELRAELSQARSDLRQTSLEFKRRLEAYEFRLEGQIRRRPVRSILLTAGLGFVIGRASRHTAVLLALVSGLVAGYAIRDSASERSRRSATQ
jgi:hypothetical protein